jgi:hypothetical protein
MELISMREWISGFRVKLLLPLLGILVLAYGVFMAFSSYSWTPSYGQITKSTMMRIMAATCNYKARFNSLPGYDMPSIVTALAGENPGKVEFIEIQPLKLKWRLWTKTFPRVDSKMNHLDAWGTPLIIDVSENAMTIRSCGPNRKDDGGRNDDITISEQF